MSWFSSNKSKTTAKKATKTNTNFLPYNQLSKNDQLAVINKMADYPPYLLKLKNHPFTAEEIHIERTIDWLNENNPIISLKAKFVKNHSLINGFIKAYFNRK